MQATATVTVTQSGVCFGKYAFMSHERITGHTAEELNSRNCSLAARAYMAWVDFALSQQVQVSPSPVEAMNLGADQIRVASMAARAEARLREARAQLSAPQPIQRQCRPGSGEVQQAHLEPASATHPVLPGPASAAVVPAGCTAALSPPPGPAGDSSGAQSDGAAGDSCLDSSEGIQLAVDGRDC